MIRGGANHILLPCDENKLGYDWGAFTSIALERDYDSKREIEDFKKSLK